MSTVYRQAIEHNYNDLVKDPKYMQVFATFQQDMANGKYGDLLAVFGQNHRGRYTGPDAYAFAHMWGWLVEGSIAIAHVDVGTTPAKDAELERNSQALANLPHPFTASVRNGVVVSNDGLLMWDENISMSYNAQPFDKVYSTCELKPSDAPLEIGTTTFERTYFHLIEEGSIARWPYGQDYITLLCVVNKSRMGASCTAPSRLAYPLPT